MECLSCRLLEQLRGEPSRGTVVERAPWGGYRNCAEPRTVFRGEVSVVEPDVGGNAESPLLPGYGER